MLLNYAFDMAGPIIETFGYLLIFVPALFVPVAAVWYIVRAFYLH